MGLFSAPVKTGVNIVKLPVSLPIAAAKDTLDYLDGKQFGDNLHGVGQEIKDDSDTD